MCDHHSRPAAGSWETQDGEVPDSWLTEDQMVNKVIRLCFDKNHPDYKGWIICNELTDEEYLQTMLEMLPRMTLIVESNEIARANGLMS